METGSRLKTILFAILVLVCEGHMGQIHPRAISLEQLIRKSECIFVVTKGKPYTRIVETELDDTKRFPPYQSPRYSYQVVKILKDERESKPAIGSKIEVAPAHDGTMLHVSRLYHLEGVHKSPILEFYDGSGSEIEKRENLIVFLRRNRDEGNYSFTANQGMEDVGKKPLVDSLLKTAAEASEKP